MRAINAAYSIGLDVTNNEAMRQQAADFAAINQASNDVFKNVVMAIDGWVMNTRQPYVTEVTDVMSFRNRKGVL